jgi:methylated-DNA-[protein]-cysteine S-methyltransferase
MSYYNAVISCPIGNIGLQWQHAKLTEVSLVSHNIVPLPYSAQQGLSRQVTQWFECYFQALGPPPLPLPLNLQGTPFQIRVWRALLRIPYGQTRTYGELAKKLNTSARAIGMACRANALLMVVPCHRVVAKNGLGGYRGSQRNRCDIKSWLLRHEQQTLSTDKESPIYELETCFF